MDSKRSRSKKASKRKERQEDGQILDQEADGEEKCYCES